MRSLPVSLMPDYEVQCCRFPLAQDGKIGWGHKLQALQQELGLGLGDAIGELALRPVHHNSFIIQRSGRFFSTAELYCRTGTRVVQLIGLYWGPEYCAYLL